MGRLVLDPTGIKRPLDLAHADALDSPAAPAAAAPTPIAAVSTASRAASVATGPPTTVAAVTPLRPPAPAPLYAAGRPIQTSLAITLDLDVRLEALARAGRVPLTPLLIATLHAGLPATAEDARRLVIAERAAQLEGERAERNVRLPAQLRARLDQLTEAVRERHRRATRADLVNAILRQALPEDAEAAAALVRAYRSRVELAMLESA